jgi:hypothetical protein
LASGYEADARIANQMALDGKIVNWMKKATDEQHRK